MAKVRQYDLDERPVRQYRATEGGTITRGEIGRSLAGCGTLDRVEGIFSVGWEESG